MAFSLHPKRSKNISNCLCHKSGVEDSLTKFSEVSWKTFKEASDLRNDEISNNMNGKWESGPFGVYHRTCYQTYTAKNLLERVAKRRKTEEDNNLVSSSDKQQADSRLTRSSIVTTHLKKCAICQDEKPDLRDRRRTENLTICETMEAGRTLLEAAKIRGNQRLVVALKDQDPIAIELCYHRTCYRAYTNTKQLEAFKRNQEGNFESQYDAAFEVLRSELEPKLFGYLEVLHMSDLRQRYVDLLCQQGIQNPLYRSEKLKVRMKKAYSGRISFWHPRNRSEAEIVYCEEVPKGQIIECSLKCNSESEMLVSSSPDNLFLKNHIYYAAKTVRAALLSQDPCMPWPPHSSDIKNENILVPNVVYNLLAWILSDDDKPVEDKVKVHVEEHCRRIVLSIAQDLLYKVTNGRQKTPKHVALPITIKNLTGSREVITLLNRYGHGISYDQVLEIETRLAENNLEAQVHGVVLPKAVRPNVFSQFCWDNIDLLEETLSGRGTTHCTNGIVVQRQVSGCDLPPVISMERSKRRRTFRAVASQIYEYNAGKRCGPGKYAEDPTLARGTDSGSKSSITKDFAWFLSRLPNPTEDNSNTLQTVPGWSGFNQVATNQEIPSKSVVGYCQLIDAPSTELATVYTLLKKSTEMATQLGLTDTVVVLDQAIYAKALEVVWKQTEEFTRVVLRMGSFHIACVFLAIIGKRFGDGGLRDLLLESTLVGSGSLNGVLEGKHYNRALRTHKVVLESLLRLSWQTFLEDTELDPEVQSLRQVVVSATTKVRKELISSTVQELYETNEVEKLRLKYEEFKKQSTSNMSAYWQSYIKMVSLLLLFIRATREGDWDLHLACVRDMLPWMFAYDRINYSRYLPVYLCDMMSLEKTHPSVYEAFQAGDFVVQRSGNAFSQVAVDQTIEQTVNRDTKSKGGIIGFSLNRGAVQRWLLTSHERAAITLACREMAGFSMTEGDRVVKEKGKERMSVDEKDVKKIQSTLATWRNPFLPSGTDEICQLASGMTATKKLEDDLLMAYDKGNKAMEAFIKKRLIKAEVPFHDPITKLKLSNFASLSLSSVKIGGKEVILKADRDLFARLLVVAQTRTDMDLQEVFTYSLGPLPWSLASVDGSLHKTVKSKLFESLFEGVEPAEDVPPTAALIVDGMAVLQSIKDIPGTFEELAATVFHLVVPPTTLARRIDFVTDTYPDISIKNPERAKRGSQEAIKVRITGGGQRCPKQWKKFLSSGENKRTLTRFLLEQWSQDSYVNQIGNRNIYFAIETQCICLSVSDGKVVCTEILELNSNHEEADTKLLLHAKHASQNGESTIIIKSPDTDVGIMACHFHREIPARLLILKKEKTRNIYLEITTIADAAGPSVCNALPGLHAFTGCDSTSAFAGKGKKNPLKLCQIDPVACETMASLGITFDKERVPFSECEGFVCKMYGRPKISGVNECRYAIFCAKQSQSQSLPPCQDALRNHTMRANYQTAIWRNALVANPEVPSPEGHGWLITDGQIEIDWMSLSPAPEALLELIICGCMGNCTTGHCTCKRNGLSCSDSCQCGDRCDNPHNYDLEEEGEDSEEDEDV